MSHLLYLRAHLARVLGLALMVSIPVVGLAAPQSANADTAPTGTTPATVSADGLPTWQINGVVWSQAVANNIVFAGGDFSAARPPGVAVGGAGEIAANDFFAYDISTGNRVAAMAHQMNGQVLAVTASPDGSRVYVGGDFTTVDGVARNHIVAIDTKTGAVITTFKASVSSQVRAIAVSGNGNTVYVGGNFFSANGSARTRLAAFTASTGAVLPWAPTADDNKVSAIVVSPDQSRVIVGGSFTTLNGAAANGMGSVDATTGTSMPWFANTVIQDGGTGSGITSLSTDGTNIYGSGYAFQSGQFEGSFSADPSTGNIVFANDCHGDTYDAWPIGQVLYTVSHAHNCSMVGGFFQSNPWSINMRHTLAFSTTPAGYNQGPDDYGWDYSAYHHSQLLQWFPVLALGTYTGQNQAAWSVTGNSNYVALGGEFPSVNSAAQQGLVRFAVRSLAPNKRAPVKAPGAPTPTANSFSAGTARVSWQAAYDMDNENLTYNVYRSGTTAPVYTTTQSSSFWNYPGMGFVDTGLAPGTSYTYTIKVTDPTGNALSLPKTNAVTISSTPASTYNNDVVNDGATDYWRLDESSGTAVLDHAGFNDATAAAGVSRGTSGAISGDPDTASTFDGASDGFVAGNSPQAATPSYSIEAWVKTTSTSGGKIVGYGDSATGNSSSYDRQIYMDNSGHINFGVYTGNTQTVRSAKAYNDGSWHHIVASESSTSGMALYVDAKKVGSDASTTTAQDFTGYWRIGGDNLGGWPNQPSSFYLNGSIDDVAIYPSALAQSQVTKHFSDAGGAAGSVAAPTDSYGKAVYQSAPDLYWRLDDASGAAKVADAGPNGEPGVVSGGVSLNQPGLVQPGTAAAFNGSDGTIGSTDTYDGPRTYSEELWFQTTTNHGGKLIGFGDKQSGNSGNYDRHVYMENSGQLTFGVWTGQTNTITTPLAYNDGKKHYLVATQGSDGMKLYVDGQLVGTNPQSSQQVYPGYWRVGGDSDWGGDSPYFNGIIDEVAVYSSELGASDVQAHYGAAGGNVPNQSPTAAFTSSVSKRTATFDAHTSNDPDGTISSYTWDFGDGSAKDTTTNSSESHDFASPGNYTVTLTVTDNNGATNSTTGGVLVSNSPPTASLTGTINRHALSVDGGGSADSDGSIVSYDWNWGDNTAHGTGGTATHNYAADGNYTVTLTVTDNDGATATATKSVTASSNQSPVASFTGTTNGLGVSVDGGNSKDPDGSIVSYDWNWGDSTTHGSGATTTHSYGSGGSYSVTLTVTDNDGATGTTSQTFTVNAVAQPQLIASDDFGRTVSNGWGSADSGGAWTLASTKTLYQVANGVGTISTATAGSGPAVSLKSISSSSSDSQLSFVPNAIPSGSGQFVSLIGRQVGTASYRAVANLRSNGTVSLTIVRVDSNGQATVVPAAIISGLTYKVGDKLDLRMQATGTSPTVMRAVVWKDGQTQPAWQQTGSDGAASMQSAGFVSLMSYLAANATAGTTVSFDGLRVYDTTGVQQAAVVQNFAAKKAEVHASDDTVPVTQQVAP